MICTASNLLYSYICKASYKYWSRLWILIFSDAKLALQPVTPGVNLAEFLPVYPDFDFFLLYRFFMHLLRCWWLSTELDGLLDIYFLSYLLHPCLLLQLFDLFLLLFLDVVIKPVDGLLHFPDWIVPCLSITGGISEGSQGKHDWWELIAHVKQNLDRLRVHVFHQPVIVHQRSHFTISLQPEHLTNCLLVGSFLRLRDRFNWSTSNRLSLWLRLFSRDSALQSEYDLSLIWHILLIEWFRMI